MKRVPQLISFDVGDEPYVGVPARFVGPVGVQIADLVRKVATDNGRDPDGPWLEYAVKLLRKAREGIEFERRSEPETRTAGSASRTDLGLSGLAAGLSTGDVQQRLRCSNSYVCRLIRSGALQARMVDGRYLVDEVSVDAFARERRNPA